MSTSILGAGSMNFLPAFAAGSLAGLPLSFFLCAAFALGTVLGSCIACLGERISHGESLCTRSRCPSCHKPLKPWHMIPLISILILKGRCAFCGRHIPLGSTFHEAAMGLICAIFLAEAVQYGLLMQQILSLYVLLFFLCLAAEVDRRTGLLPDSLLLPALLAAICHAAISHAAISHATQTSSGLAFSGALLSGALMTAFAWGASAALLFLLLRFGWIRLYGTEAIGTGDACLAFILGLVTKESVFLAVAIASLLAMLAVLHKQCRKAFYVRELAAKGAIPFGPFLVAGGIAVMIFCR